MSTPDNQGPGISAAESDPVVAQASPGARGAWIQRTGTLRRAAVVRVGLLMLLAFGAAALALSFLLYLADDVLERETQQFDQGVLVWLHQFSSPQLDLAARGVSMFGSELVAVFAVVLLVWCVVQRRWGTAVSLILVVGGAQLLNDLLKQLVHRTRPTPVGATLLGQAYSFPSGHAMVGIAFYTLVAYLGWRLLHGWMRILWVGSLALLVLLIGLARLYLEVHYPTDVLAGYLAGFLWTEAVLVGGHLLGPTVTARQRRDPQPATPTPVHIG